MSRLSAYQHVALRDRIQKTPVVRRDQHCGAAVEQLLFELFLAIDVDVVGRLVENQEIRCA